MADRRNFTKKKSPAVGVKAVGWLGNDERFFLERLEVRARLEVGKQGTEGLQHFTPDSLALELKRPIYVLRVEEFTGKRVILQFFFFFLPDWLPETVQRAKERPRLVLRVRYYHPAQLVAPEFAAVIQEEIDRILGL